MLLALSIGGAVPAGMSGRLRTWRQRLPLGLMGLRKRDGIVERLDNRRRPSAHWSG